MILVMRTDAPEVYVGLWDGATEQWSKEWEAGRELSKQLLEIIESNCKKFAISIAELDGVVVYKGPGSYTGLRIGMSVANAIGYSNNKPVVATSGENWIKHGLGEISKATGFSPATPEYGGNTRVTKPKK